MTTITDQEMIYALRGQLEELGRARDEIAARLAEVEQTPHPLRYVGRLDGLEKLLSPRPCWLCGAPLVDGSHVCRCIRHQQGPAEDCVQCARRAEWEQPHV